MNLNSKWHHIMLEIAHSVAKLPGVKTLLKPIYYPIKRRIEESQRKTLMNNGLKVLQRFDKCMEKVGVEYTITFGTLLGAIRDKGFMNHDLDIDVAVWNNHYSERMISALKSEGFELIHSFVVEDGSIGREDTFSCDGVAIDIFYIFNDEGEYPYYCGFGTIGECATFSQSMRKYGKIKARRMDIPMTRERVKIPFEHIELYAPSNAHEILSFIYGNDYITPQPSWQMDSRKFNWMDKPAYYYEM